MTSHHFCEIVVYLRSCQGQSSKGRLTSKISKIFFVCLAGLSSSYISSLCFLEYDLVCLFFMRSLLLSRYYSLPSVWPQNSFLLVKQTQHPNVNQYRVKFT